MKAAKQAHLQRIRSETAYPTYRAIINVIAVLGYILAVLSGLAALVNGFKVMGHSFIIGVVVLLIGLITAALIFVGARFWKEAALILADIGDSVTDAHAGDGKDTQPS